jgi:hypothetical protein
MAIGKLIEFFLIRFQTRRNEQTIEWLVKGRCIPLMSQNLVVVCLFDGKINQHEKEVKQAQELELVKCRTKTAR